MIAHLKKGKTGRYAKTVSLRVNPMNTASITVTEKRLTLEMDKACKLPAQSYSRENKNILKF